MSAPVYSTHTVDELDEAVNTVLNDLGTAALLDRGVANGVASLDSGGKVPTAQLPAAILGALNYQGTWNATTNTPTLVTGVGTKGYYYKVSVAGTTTIDGVSVWNIGDLIAYNGATWDKYDDVDEDATTSIKGVVKLATDLGGTAGAPTVVGLQGDALPAKTANKFTKRDSGNTAWEDVGYGALANTVTEGNDSRLSDSRAPNGSASGDLAGSFPSPTVKQSSTAFAFTGVISDTISADQNDYNPTSLSSASVVRVIVNNISPLNLTGLAGGAAGRCIRIVNVATSGSRALVLKANNASSTAANRFGMAGDYSLAGLGGFVDLWYDSTSSLWRVGAPAAASGTVPGLLTIGTDLSGTGALPTVKQTSVAFAFASQLTPAQISSNQNNYAGGVTSTAGNILIVNSDAARDITGIVQGFAGRILALHNNGSFPITLKHQNGSSTAANRFDIGTDLVLPASGMVMLQYDSTASRWHISGAGIYLPLVGGTITGDVTLSARLTVDKVSDNIAALAFSSTPSFDFDGKSAQTLALTGNITPTTANKAVGRMLKIYMSADVSGPYTFTWPSWRWVTAIPSAIAASKSAILTLECVFGTADTDIVAGYAVQA